MDDAVPGEAPSVSLIRSTQKSRFLDIESIDHDMSEHRTHMHTDTDTQLTVQGNGGEDYVRSRRFIQNSSCASVRRKTVKRSKTLYL